MTTRNYAKIHRIPDVVQGTLGGKFVLTIHNCFEIKDSLKARGFKWGFPMGVQLSEKCWHGVVKDFKSLANILRKLQELGVYVSTSEIAGYPKNHENYGEVNPELTTTRFLIELVDDYDTKEELAESVKEAAKLLAGVTIKYGGERVLKDGEWTQTIPAAEFTF